MNDELMGLSFEEALGELEETVAHLEAGDLTLEESLALFERGQHLSAYCNALLDKAELRVELLTADGEIVDMTDNDD
jgi:exodeoxyribonuclease VII small subunit